MIDILINILFIGLLVVFAALLFVGAKIKNAYKNQAIILDAIFRYHKSLIDMYNFNYEVNYEDIEPYDATLRRWTDWDYKNILPEDKFKIIEPYILKQ